MSSKLIRPIRALPLLAALAVLAALPAVAGATTLSMKWNRSVLLENPSKGGALDAIACAPTVKTSRSLLCVAGDVHGGIWASVHPARSAANWHRAYIDNRGNAITGVSCPSTTLCVAVDSSGQVMHSTRPTGGVKYWSKPSRIDKATQPGGGYAGFSAISCPSTKLCVAVDNSVNGQVAYTTDPTGPGSAWSLTTIGNGITLNSVACASTTLCLIGGSGRFYSTTPTGAASAWKATGSLSTSAAVIASLACKTVKLCVGVGYGNAGAGLATASSVPATTTWQPSAIGSDPPAPGAGLADSVACPQRNFCVAVDAASNAYTTTTPVRGNWSTAKRLKKASQATDSQVACNETICVEVDNRGTVTYGAVKGASTKTTTKTTKTSTSTTKTTTKTSTGTTTTG